LATRRNSCAVLQAWVFERAALLDGLLEEIAGLSWSPRRAWRRRQVQASAMPRRTGTPDAGTLQRFGGGSDGFLEMAGGEVDLRQFEADEDRPVAEAAPVVAWSGDHATTEIAVPLS